MSNLKRFGVTKVVTKSCLTVHCDQQQHYKKQGFRIGEREETLRSLYELHYVRRQGTMMCNVKRRWRTKQGVKLSLMRRARRTGVDDGYGCLLGVLRYL